MKKKNLAEELKIRGLIEQAGGGDIEEIIKTRRIVYLGIDPTADSLHVGNLVPIILVKHLVNAGHKPIFLVGGGTGMIGDPRESGERVLLDEKTVASNTKAIKTQLSHILGKSKFIILDNATWLKKLGAIEFLRDVGKYFTVNQLIKREIIKRRLENDEDSISFTEFSYSLLQAYDYLYLNKKHKVDLQIGGSDQWANIISGVDLVRRREGKKVYALTAPIVMDKVTHKKFGKSEGNAIWLGPLKTPPFIFYQFWFNLPDESIEDYLKIFTFLSLEKIARTLAEHKKYPQKRVAQKCLASEVTGLIHTNAVALAVEKVSGVIFGTHSLFSLSKEECAMIAKDVPGARIGRESLKNGLLVPETLVTAGLASSKGEARRLIEAGGISLNGEVVKTPHDLIYIKDFHHNVLLLQRGKKIAVLSFNK